MVIVFLAAVSIGALLPPGQDAGHISNLSYTGVTSLDNLSKYIAESSGVSVRVESGLGEQIVVLSVRNETVRAILERISTVLSCEVAEDNGSFRLFRSPDLTRRLQATSLQIRTARTIKAVETISKRALEKVSAEQIANNLVEDLKQRIAGLVPYNPAAPSSPPTPMLVLLARLTAEVGAAAIAKLPVSETAVFSNKPTQMERTLSGSANKQIAAYKDLQQVVANMLPPDIPATSGNEYRDRLYRESWTSFLKASRNAANADVVLLDINPLRDMIILKLSLYSQNGELLSSVGVNCPLPLPEIDQSELPGERDLGDVEMTASAAVRMLSLQRATFSVPLDVEQRYPEQAAKDFAEPLRVDPIQYWMGEASIATARGLQAKLVASFNDRMDQRVPIWAKQSQFNLPKFLRSARTSGHSVKLDASWLLLSPIDPVDADQSRVPRNAIDKMVKAAARSKFLGFRDFTRFQYGAGRSITPSEGLVYRCILPGLGVDFESANFPYRSSSLMLGFLGSLSEMHWRILESNGDISIGALSPAQRGMLNTWIRPRLAEPSTSGQLSELNRRGTRTFPTGVNNKCNLRGDWKTEQVAVPVGQANGEGAFPNGYFISCSAEQLADSAGYSLAAGDFSSIEQAFAGRWLFGKRREGRIIITADNGASFAENVACPAQIAGQSSVPYAGLPPEFRAQVLSILKTKYGWPKTAGGEDKRLTTSAATFFR